MKEFNGNKFYDIYDLHRIVETNNIELFYRNLQAHVFFDGLVNVVHSNIENLERTERLLYNSIINDINQPSLICLPNTTDSLKKELIFKQTLNFKGFFNFVLSDTRSLCLYPTLSCSIDGNNSNENEDFYFVIDLADICMSLDRKLIQETDINDDFLYIYQLRNNFQNSQAGQILNIYFLESEILDYAERKGITVNLSKAITFADQLSSDIERNLKVLGVDEKTIDVMMKREKSNEEIDERINPNTENHNEAIKLLDTIEDKIKGKDRVAKENVDKACDMLEYGTNGELINSTKISKEKTLFSEKIKQYITTKRQTHNIRFLLFAFSDYFNKFPDTKTLPTFNDFKLFLITRKDEQDNTYFHDITDNKIILPEANSLKISNIRKAYNNLVLEIKKSV